MLTASGPVPIEEIVVGTEVLAYSPSAEECNLHKVIQAHCSLTNQLLFIELERGTIKCTPTHPFWCIGKGWVLADALSADDVLLNSSLEPVAIRSIDSMVLSGPTPVYNLSVSGPHTYFVGEAEVLVHNKLPI